MGTIASSLRRYAAVLSAAAPLLGCDAKTRLGEEAPAATKATAAESRAFSGWAAVPVPPADGPQLAPIFLVAPVHAEPDPASATIGYLRVGARVARSEKAVAKTGCAAGWYAIRPLGFVCAEREATVDLESPISRAIRVEPDRSHAMPYKYAFLRAIAPNYLRIPTKDEQFRYEMRLERHLRNWKRLSHQWDELDVGANDVPLDERGLAVGDIPEHATPMGISERFGGDGQDAVPWWLEGQRRIPNLSSFKAPPYAAIADRIKRHAGVALIGTFVAGPEAQDRRFAVTADARLIPADKLKADSGSPFHGHDIRKDGLPVAFARKTDASYWHWDGTGLREGEKLRFREFIALTGRVKQLRGDRVVETRDGRWVKSEDVKTAVKPGSLPWFATKRTRWIDISLLNQTLVLWEGSDPIYVTLVSTGRDGVGDPKTTLSTPTGDFRIYQKHVTTTMDSEVADAEFELRDVPWVMYFKGGYALHAAYWHDDFGRARSHGCVNLAPIDARYVFWWSAPDVPEHWHAAYGGDAFGQGTLVHIHP